MTTLNAFETQLVDAGHATTEEPSFTEPQTLSSNYRASNGFCLFFPKPPVNGFAADAAYQRADTLAKEIGGVVVSSDQDIHGARPSFWVYRHYADVPAKDYGRIEEDYSWRKPSLSLPLDGWVDIAKLTGEESDDQVEDNEGYSNDGESITAGVLLEDGTPVRLSVNNSNYNGNFAETAFATYFPAFELLDSSGWDVGGPGEDVVICSVGEMEFEHDYADYGFTKITLPKVGEVLARAVGADKCWRDHICNAPFRAEIIRSSIQGYLAEGETVPEDHDFELIYEKSQRCAGYELNWFDIPETEREKLIVATNGILDEYFSQLALKRDEDKQINYGFGAQHGLARTSLLILSALLIAGLLAVGAYFAHAQKRITEDDPRWDCHTMGNRICGPERAVAAQAAPSRNSDKPSAIDTRETKPAYYCGAPTKKGTPCRSRVKQAGELCWIHRAKEAK